MTPDFQLLNHLLRKDKINTTLESSGVTNKRRNTMLGEARLGPQPKLILGLNPLLKPFQTDIISTTITLSLQFRQLILLLRLLDKLLLTLKLLLMSGERDSHLTLDQFLLLVNKELFQMDTTTTLITLRNLFSTLTLLLRPLDKQLSTLKKPLMRGEKDSHQTQAQFSHLINKELFQTDTTSTTTTLRLQSTILTPPLRLRELPQ